MRSRNHQINLLLAGLTVMALLFFFAVTASAKTDKSGRYYFDELRQSIIDVINENQSLINRTPEGKTKNPDLLPDAYYEKINKTLITIVGTEYPLDELDHVYDPAKICHVLACLLEAGRTTTAKFQTLINTESDGSVKLKKFIPAVFGRLTGERYAAKTGVELKQTTMGRRDFKARNPYNQPDEWEVLALETFSRLCWIKNQGFSELKKDHYRYMKPLYIKKACLKCHGGPIGSKGPYGHAKEGYWVSDIRGGISIKLKNTR